MRGHEQAGRRFCVVVQSDELASMSTVIVAPTSTRAQPTSFRPEISIGGSRTRVMLEHVQAVDPGRLGESHGLVGYGELEDIDRALLTVLGLDR